MIKNNKIWKINFASYANKKLNNSSDNTIIHKKILNNNRQEL